MIEQYWQSMSTIYIIPFSVLETLPKLTSDVVGVFPAILNINMTLDLFIEEQLLSISWSESQIYISGNI